MMTTMPDMDSAEQLAKALVDHSLAACVNILPEMQSIYRWQGKQRHGSEHQLIIKTHADCYQAIEDYIKENHPYELPEIISLPIEQGLQGYLDWVTETTRKTDEPDH